MKKVLVFFSISILLASSLWVFRNSILEKSLEFFLNQTQAAFFDQSLELEGVHLDRSLKLHVQKVTGDWQTSEKPFPFDVENIQVQDSAVNFILRKPVRITFEKFSPRDSIHPGVTGDAVLHLDQEDTMELKAQFAGVYLEELLAFDPEHLKGASGKMTGDFYLKTTKSGEQDFRLDLKVTPPGGRLQARFFDLLLPYLPATEKAVLQTIRDIQTVPYKEADLKLKLVSPEAVNLFLHIAVPDYNLNLNLNVTLRVEDEEAFLQLASLMGLIKIEGT